MTLRFAVLAAAVASLQTAVAFTTLPLVGKSSYRTAPRPLFANAIEQAEALKAQAEKIRLEAEKMDAQLTLEKVNSLEKKLNDKTWRERHPDKEEELRKQLNGLNNKLRGNKTPAVEKKTASTPESTTTRETISATETPKKVESPKKRPPPVENPISGFDAEDLELYLPVARRIEEEMANATIDEKLEAFRQEPELQQHFSEKIQALLVGPMEDLQKLESYKYQYLSSTSSVEKEQLKRQINALESAIEKESPFMYSTSVYRDIPAMSDEELQERVNALEELPEVLQSLYKKRNEVADDADLRLAILVEHYEPQLQLLDQVRFVAPLDQEGRQEAIRGYESMPSMVRDHFCNNISLPPGSDAETVIKELQGGASEMNLGGFGKVVVEASKSMDLPEYTDIEFMDRSR